MRSFTGVSVLAALLVLATLASAQPSPGPRGRGGWGPNNAYGRLFDPKTVETVRGEIVVVERFVPMQGMSGGIHLRLKTATGVLDVHLGPAWFLDHQHIALTKGDRVEVRGSRVVIAGKPAIIAAQVVRGRDVLRLRDEQGIPVWSGWRRRSGR